MGSAILVNKFPKMGAEGGRVVTLLGPNKEKGMDTTSGRVTGTLLVVPVAYSLMDRWLVHQSVVAVQEG